jgi:hypothetical protein
MRSADSAKQANVVQIKWSIGSRLLIRSMLMNQLWSKWGRTHSSHQPFHDWCCLKSLANPKRLTLYTSCPMITSKIILFSFVTPVTCYISVSCLSVHECCNPRESVLLTTIYSGLLYRRCWVYFRWMSEWICAVSVTQRAEDSVNWGKYSTKIKMIIQKSAKWISCQPSKIEDFGIQ